MRSALMAVLLLGILAASLAADDPTPTPTPTPTPEVTPTPPSGAESAVRPTPIVITNENLKEFAEKGRLTTVGEATTKPTPRASDPGRDYDRSRARAEETGLTPEMAATYGVELENPAAERERRDYWRSRYLQQKKRIEALEEQLEHLSSEIPRLWNQFYATDDPAYRDGVIKPQLDQMIERHDEIEKELVEARELLPKIKTDARRDGAQPGWFRGL